MELGSLKVALVHDFLNQYGGAERVLETIHELFPRSTVYTLIYEPDQLPEHFRKWRIYESPYASLIPFRKKYYKLWLPKYPLFIEQFDLRRYDLVLSSSYLFAKGVITPSRTPHICYCHTPMRQAWELYHNYKEDHSPGLIRVLYALLFHYLRLWDAHSAQRADYFIANSKAVQMRIRKYYRRESTVIYPPVDTEQFYISNTVDDYYLFLSRLVPYKNADLAVRAFNQSGLKLIVAGDGPELKSLKNIALSNIQFVGLVSEKRKAELLANCKAFIFPALEDFGIVSVEAQASGRPVIAYRGGGSLDTVIENKTGVFFDSFTPQSIIQAVAKLDQIRFYPEAIREHALQFDRLNFISKLTEYLENIPGV